eukprot:4952591-Amphidinium_carterae.1
MMTPTKQSRAQCALPNGPEQRAAQRALPKGPEQRRTVSYRLTRMRRQGRPPPRQGAHEGAWEGCPPHLRWSRAALCSSGLEAHLQLDRSCT